MRRNLGSDPLNTHPLTECPACRFRLDVLKDSICIECSKNKKLVVCRNCKFRCKICSFCDKELETEIKDKDYTYAGNSSWILWILLGVTVLIIALWYFSLSSESHDGMRVILGNLKKEFPSQRNETWYHFLSVLEKETATVKSITLLHGEDKRTPDCLTSKLVSLYSGDENIRREDITFSAAGFETMDYGFALEHYRKVVQTFRVFVTDLTKVPGNIARIFHSLCDEVSSDIKPSLFIFSLKFDKRTEKLKPMERANRILKEAWSDLPDNEMFPLLSRIVKNVVDVVPENKASC